MEKALATIYLVILNAIAFSLGVWVTFGSAWYSYGGADIPAAIFFIAAFPSPLIFVYRFFRDRYGFSTRTFFRCTLLPPHIVSLISGALILMMGAAAGGWGGLGALSVAVTWYFAKIGLIISATAWVWMDECLAAIKRYNGRKALSIILLTLCGAALGNSAYMFLEPIPLPRVYAKDLTELIVQELAVAVIVAVPIGIGLTALARFYGRKYLLGFPIFLLCAFLPSISLGVWRAVANFRDEEYLFIRDQFLYPLKSLAVLLTTLAVTVILYVIVLAVRRKKCY